MSSSELEMEMTDGMNKVTMENVEPTDTLPMISTSSDTGSNTIELVTTTTITMDIATEPPALQVPVASLEPLSTTTPSTVPLLEATKPTESMIPQQEQIPLETLSLVEPASSVAIVPSDSAPLMEGVILHMETPLEEGTEKARMEQTNEDEDNSENEDIDRMDDSTNPYAQIVGFQTCDFQNLNYKPFVLPTAAPVNEILVFNVCGKKPIEKHTVALKKKKRKTEEPKKEKKKKPQKLPVRVEETTKSAPSIVPPPVDTSKTTLKPPVITVEEVTKPIAVVAPPTPPVPATPPQRKSKKKEIKENVAKKIPFATTLQMSNFQKAEHVKESCSLLKNSFAGLTIYHSRNKLLMARLVTAHVTETSNNTPANWYSLRWEFPIGSGIVYSNIWILTAQAILYMWRIDKKEPLLNIEGHDIKSYYSLWFYLRNGEYRPLSEIFTPNVLDGSVSIDPGKLPEASITFSQQSPQRAKMGTFKFTPRLSLIDGFVTNCIETAENELQKRKEQADMEEERKENVIETFWNQFKPWLPENSVIPQFRQLTFSEEEMMQKYIQDHSLAREPELSTYDERCDKMSGYDSDYPNLKYVLKKIHMKEGQTSAKTLPLTLRLLYDGARGNQLTAKQSPPPRDNRGRRPAHVQDKRQQPLQPHYSPSHHHHHQQPLQQKPKGKREESYILSCLRIFNYKPHSPEFYQAVGCVACDKDMLHPDNYDCMAQIDIDKRGKMMNANTGFRCYSDDKHTFCPKHFLDGILFQLIHLNFPLQCPFGFHYQYCGIDVRQSERNFCDFVIPPHYVESYIQSSTLSVSAKNFWLARLELAEENYHAYLCQRNVNPDLSFHICQKIIQFEERQMICGTLFEICPLKSGTIPTLYECTGPCQSRYCITCEQPMSVADIAEHTSCKRWFHYPLMESKEGEPLSMSLERVFANAKRNLHRTVEFNELLQRFTLQYIISYFMLNWTRVCPCCSKRYSFYSKMPVRDHPMVQKGHHQQHHSSHTATMTMKTASTAPSTSISTTIPGDTFPITYIDHGNERDQNWIRCSCGIDWCMVCSRILAKSEAQFLRLKKAIANGIKTGLMKDIQLYQLNSQYAPAHTHYSDLSPLFNLPNALKSFNNCPLTMYAMSTCESYSSILDFVENNPQSFETTLWNELFIASKYELTGKLDPSAMRAAVSLFPAWIREPLKETKCTWG